MMWAQLFSLTGAMAVFLLGARPLFRLALRLYTDKVLAGYGLRLEELLYSYEEITYFVNIPTNNEDILQARKEDLKLTLLYSSRLFPSIKGVQVFLRLNDHESMQIAYLPLERYCIPLLRIFIMRGQMTKETYRRIVSSKLMRPKTEQEILDEVFRQIRSSARLV